MPNPLLLLLLCFLPLTALSCGSSSGGGPIEDLCEDYSKTISICLDGFDQGEGARADECVDSIDDSKEVDGQVCADALVDAYACVTDDATNCPQDSVNLFFFLDLRYNELFNQTTGEETAPLDFCDAEIRGVVRECPESVELIGAPRV